MTLPNTFWSNSVAAAVDSAALGNKVVAWEELSVHRYRAISIDPMIVWEGVVAVVGIVMAGRVYAGAALVADTETLSEDRSGLISG